MNRLFQPLFVLLMCLSVGCGKQSWKVEEIDSPAGSGSGMPYLRASADEVWMSWTEQSGGKANLMSASWNGKWSKPQTIVSSDQLFVNWADFPSIFPLSKGEVFVHWLQKSGKDKYAYHVMSAVSKDRGQNWNPPIRVHTDTTDTEHGFASFAELPNGLLSISWLDAREYKTQNAMALMSATFQEGTFVNETSIDPRVCDCCQTDAASIPGGLFVVYRDRSEEEIRDIYSVRFINGRWTSPKAIHADGWKIDGCPVNGPSVSTDGERVAVAWYTGANDQPRVYAAFSQDAGASFSAPIRVDSGNPSGRVDVEILHDGSAVVSWMENQKEKGADIRIRNIFPDGKAHEPVIVADTSNARSSGVPRMTRAGNHLFIAWTFTSDPSKIRVAKISLPM